MVKRRAMSEKSVMNRHQLRLNRDATRELRALPSRSATYLCCAALGALLALLPARAAHADDEATTAVARERFKEGVQFFDQKQYDKSRAAFLQAYALKRHPAVLLNLAQSELRSGHEADAAKHFAQFSRESKEATDSERQSAESGLSAAKAVIAEVTVNVDEEGATVSIDGNVEAQSPLPGPIYLTPGAHTLTAKKDSREASVQLTAVAGQTSSTNLRFKKTGAAPAPPAENEPKGATEAKEPSESKPSESEPSPEPGEPERQKKPFGKWLTSSPVPRIGGAIAVVGLGTGIGFAIAAKHSFNNANSVADQINKATAIDGIPSNGICSNTAKQNALGDKRAGEYRNACTKYQDNVDSGDRFKTISTIGWIAAGAAVATTLIVYAVDGKEDAPTAARTPRKATAVIGPWLTNSEHGIFVGGRF